MRIQSLAVVGLSAFLLAGCQSLFNTAHRETAGKTARVIGQPASPDEELAKGRQALEGRLFAEAIAAFSTLRRDGEHAGEALNGLAIAYAGLGRHDLAERFFRQAIAASPGDRRFHRNLARFYAENPATPIRQADRTGVSGMAGRDSGMEIAGIEGRVLPGSGVRAAIRIHVSAQAMARVSPREVMVKTTPAAPPANVSGLRQVQTDATGRRRNPNYPARIEFVRIGAAREAPASAVGLTLASKEN